MTCFDVDSGNCVLVVAGETTVVLSNALVDCLAVEISTVDFVTSDVAGSVVGILESVVETVVVL